MKYLKLVNVPISEFCNHAKLSNGEKRIPWTECGFDIEIVKSKAVLYEDDNEDRIQYIPISKEAKVKELLAKMKDVLSTDGFKASIVSETDTNKQSKWAESRDSSKLKQAVRAERRRLQINADAQKSE